MLDPDIESITAYFLTFWLILSHDEHIFAGKIISVRITAANKFMVTDYFCRGKEVNRYYIIEIQGLWFVKGYILWPVNVSNFERVRKWHRISEGRW